MNYLHSPCCLRFNDDVEPSRQGPLLKLFAISQLEARLMQVAMADSPLTADDFAVYSWVRLTGPITPTQLAADLGMRQPTLSNYLRRMSERGHLRRRPHPEDGRSQLVSLTASGTRITVRSFPGFQLAISSFTERLQLPAEEIGRALDGISNAFEEAIADIETSRRDQLGA